MTINGYEKCVCTSHESIFLGSLCWAEMQVKKGWLFMFAINFIPSLLFTFKNYVWVATIHHESNCQRWRRRRRKRHNKWRSQLYFLISIYFFFVKNLIFIREMYVFYSVEVINFTITVKFYNLEQLLEIQNPIQYDLLKWWNVLETLDKCN